MISTSYVVDTHDWPWRWVAVIQTDDGQHQRSCFTYRGAKRWIKHRSAMINEGLIEI